MRATLSPLAGEGERRRTEETIILGTTLSLSLSYVTVKYTINK